jgi:ABC-type transport system involved in multi-copper enzyme maturation permease subunit
MNALLKKEIRLLLPSFLIGCALTFSNWLLMWKHNDALSSMLSLLPMVVCPAVAVMMALDSFGGEVSSGTFTNLLAQPVSRLKIWETKISLLATALLVVGVLWFGSFFCVRVFFSNNIPSDSSDLGDTFVAGVMFALVVFSGGLWTVLLLRQVAAAFWFTLLVPGVLMMILAAFFTDYDGNFFEGMIISVLGLYSLAGLFFARWLFFRAQDAQWSGGTIAMPEMSGLPVWLTKSATQRILRPRAALWRKEFQLHQSQFIMAFALLLLHLGVLATRHFYDLRRSSDLKYALEIFWGLWLVMPVLVGCAAVAEERKLGTLEGQLCLPAKRRTQFTIKFSVMIILSVLLGVVMPLLLEGSRILPNVHFNFNSLRAGMFTQIDVGQILSAGQVLYWNCLEAINRLLPLLTLAGIATAFGAISFYVSSLMRNTLQTLAPSVLGIGLMFFGFVVVSQMPDYDLDFLWHGPLPYFIGVPVMLLTLLALAFWNFQHVRTGWRMWWRNFFMLVLALVFAVTATTAVYHRAWEKLTPFEPSHGAERLSPSNPPIMNAQWDDISVRFPDGKIWMSYFIKSPTALNPLALMLGNFKVALVDDKFITGSNWTSVKRTGGGLVGIKTDGSLWVSERLWQTNRWPNGRWKADNDAIQHLVPFGNETNWSSFVPASLFTLLLKTDGTLWRWGAANFDSSHNQWPGLRTFTPQRLGTESNWAEFYYYSGNYYQWFLRKTDGSLRTWNQGWDTNGETLLQLEPKFTLQSVKNLGRDRFRSVALVSHGLQYKVGVHDDGTFRIWAEQRLDSDKSNRYGNYNWFPTDLQIGDGTRWHVVAAGDSDKIVTLKDDGSLWLWDFYFNYRRTARWETDLLAREIQDTRPVHLGTHSDWTAIVSANGGIISLAADGSLWFWPLDRADYYENVYYSGNGDGSQFEPLLDISHKPQFLGNIFAKRD